MIENVLQPLIYQGFIREECVYPGEMGKRLDAADITLKQGLLFHLLKEKCSHARFIYSLRFPFFLL